MFQKHCKDLPALLALLDSPSQPTKVPTKQQDTYTQHVSTITPTLHQTTMQKHTKVQTKQQETYTQHVSTITPTLHQTAMQENGTHRSKILRNSLGVTLDGP